MRKKCAVLRRVHLTLLCYTTICHAVQKRGLDLDPGHVDGAQQSTAELDNAVLGSQLQHNQVNVSSFVCSQLSSDFVFHAGQSCPDLFNLPSWS